MTDRDQKWCSEMPSAAARAWNALRRPRRRCRPRPRRGFHTGAPSGRTQARRQSGGWLLGGGASCTACTGSSIRGSSPSARTSSSRRALRRPQLCRSGEAAAETTSAPACRCPRRLPSRPVGSIIRHGSEAMHELPNEVLEPPAGREVLHVERVDRTGRRASHRGGSLPFSGRFVMPRPWEYWGLRSGPGLDSGFLAALLPIPGLRSGFLGCAADSRGLRGAFPGPPQQNSGAS